MGKTRPTTPTASGRSRSNDKNQPHSSGARPEHAVDEHDENESNDNIHRTDTIRHSSHISSSAGTTTNTAMTAAATAVHPKPSGIGAIGTASTGLINPLPTPTPPPPPPCDLDRRIATLENRLLEDGIGSALPPQPRGGGTFPTSAAVTAAASGADHKDGPTSSSSSSANANDNIASKEDEVLQTFFSTLRCMSNNVARTPSHPHPHIRDTKSRALNAILTILELSLEETSKLSQQVRGGQSREEEFKHVMGGLVQRVEVLTKQVEEKDCVIGQAQERVGELSEELTQAQEKMKEMAEEMANLSSLSRSCADGKDVSACTTEEDGEAKADSKWKEEKDSVDDAVVGQIREENERLRNIVEQMGGQQEQQREEQRQRQKQQQQQHAHQQQQQQKQQHRSAHEAIHVELRAQAALLEEENRRLLQHLNGATGSETDLGTPAYLLGNSSDAAATTSNSRANQLLRAQNDELQRALQDRDERLARCESNLRALVEQGRTASAETSRLAAEGGAARRRLGEEMRRAETAERKAKDVEREKLDVMRAYQAVVHERAQLQAQVGQLDQEHSRLQQELTVLQSQFMQIQGELKQRSVESTDANRDNETLRRSIETVEAQNIGLRREVEISRQCSGATTDQFVKLQAEITTCHRECAELRQTVSMLECDKSRLESTLKEEKDRQEKIEGMLSTTRAREAASADKIANLSRENARLAMKLNEADARVEAASIQRSKRGQKNSSTPRQPQVLSESRINGVMDEGVPKSISFETKIPPGK